MTSWNQMSLLEAAEQILLQHKQPMSFLELFQLICEAKELSEVERNEIIAQVYADFITSAKFVYVGDDQWDLKSRQSIDLWDKDGAFYQEFPDYEEDLEEIEEDEEEDDDLKEDDDEEDDDLEEDEFEEEDEIEKEADFDEFEDDIDYEDFVDDEAEFVEDEEDIVVEDAEDFDDEKYNEYMDDYEKMYDE